MRCPHCQHDNPAAVKFCGECGTRLEFACPACGAANPPENKFCGQCGASLTPTGAISKFASPKAYTPKHLDEHEPVVAETGKKDGSAKITE